LFNGPAWVEGKCGRALSFDGVNDYVQSNSIINPIPTTAHTFTLWFKLNRDRYLGDTLEFWGLIEGGYAPNTWNHHYLFIVPGYLYYYHAETEPLYLTARCDFQANKWYFVAITADGGNRKLYIDGTKVAESTDGTGNSDQLRIIVFGANKYFGIGAFLNGAIDEVKIYSRALSADEIRQEFEKAFMRGDANGDDHITVSDVVYLVNYLFKGGPRPISIQAADVNCDGRVTISDVVYLINYLFKSGPPPCGPSPC